MSLTQEKVEIPHVTVMIFIVLNECLMIVEKCVFKLNFSKWLKIQVPGRLTVAQLSSFMIDRSSTVAFMSVSNTLENMGLFHTM